MAHESSIRYSLLTRAGLRAVALEHPETAPLDAAMRAAIAASVRILGFDNRPGSLQRQCTMGLFVAALSDRLALAFPLSADALKAVVFSPSTRGNPTTPLPQQSNQRA